MPADAHPRGREPDHDELVRDIDARCRLHGTFVLRSGLTAAQYFDKFLFESDPDLLRRVAEKMVPLVPSGTDMLGGLELGGIPIVTALSALTGLPALFVRKQAKAYGTMRIAEGGEVTARTVTLIEDVITTGGAVRNAAAALRAESATVTTVVCAIDRSEPGSHPLSDASVEVRAVMTRAMLDAVASARPRT